MKQNNKKVLKLKKFLTCQTKSEIWKKVPKLKNNNWKKYIEKNILKKIYWKKYIEKNIIKKKIKKKILKKD